MIRPAIGTALAVGKATSIANKLQNISNNTSSGGNSSGSTTVNVTMPDGSTKQGVVDEHGVTTVDGKRPPEGSVVHTPGGDYMMKGDKGVPVTPIPIERDGVKGTGYVSHDDDQTYVLGGIRAPDGTIVDIGNERYIVEGGKGRLYSGDDVKKPNPTPTPSPSPNPLPPQLGGGEKNNANKGTDSYHTPVKDAHNKSRGYSSGHRGIDFQGMKNGARKLDESLAYAVHDGELSFHFSFYVGNDGEVYFNSYGIYAILEYSITLDDGSTVKYQIYYAHLYSYCDNVMMDALNSMIRDTLNSSSEMKGMVNQKYLEDGFDIVGEMTYFDGIRSTRQSSAQSKVPQASRTKTGTAGSRSVAVGDAIGYIGNTGNSYGTHLHFEAKEKKPGSIQYTQIDPEKWMDRVGIK